MVKNYTHIPLYFAIFQGLHPCLIDHLRDYIHAVLLWTEQQPPGLVLVIFVALFTLVSLPLAWGYIVVNLACGNSQNSIISIIIDCVIFVALFTLVSLPLAWGYIVVNLAGVNFITSAMIIIIIIIVLVVIFHFNHFVLHFINMI